MLILLPPSEGKTAPAAGDPLDLTALSSPRLHRTREQLLNALVRVSGTRRGAEVLGLGPAQAEDLARNTRLREEPTAAAIEVYTGVLYGELDWASLSDPARARGAEQVAIASALFGIVRPDDQIPAYRLSGGASLPRLGTVTSRWRPVLPRAINELAGGDLVVDLRSGVYVNHGPVDAVTIRVLTETDGRRTVVSHHNKATKGRIVREVLSEGVDADDAAGFATALRDLGWTVDHTAHHLDVLT